MHISPMMHPWLSLYSPPFPFYSLSPLLLLSVLDIPSARPHRLPEFLARTEAHRHNASPLESTKTEHNANPLESTEQLEYKSSLSKVQNTECKVL